MDIKTAGAYEILKMEIKKNAEFNNCSIDVTVKTQHGTQTINEWLFFNYKNTGYLIDDAHRADNSVKLFKLFPDANEVDAMWWDRSSVDGRVTALYAEMSAWVEKQAIK